MKKKTKNYKTIQEAIDNEGGLSERQYGFRKGRSTIDVVKMVRDATLEGGRWVTLIILDVKNAFNTADWRHILGIGRKPYPSISTKPY